MTYFGDETNSSYDFLQSIHIILQALIFGTGLFIHRKTIQVQVEEKHRTWRMHVFHAGMLTVFFGFSISFGAIIRILPSLASYTGSWICYIASFNTFYGYHAVLGHSLWISIEKYIFIVHSLKARAFGEQMVEKIFFLVDLIVPGLLTTAAMITTDYQTRSELKNCFDGSIEHYEQQNTSSSLSEKFIFCDVSMYSNNHWIVPYVVQLLCVSRFTINFITGFNMVEGFFYYKIFKTMKRQTNPAPENAAACSLSSNIQDRNIRKVEVNACVTSVLWIIEIAAMLWSTFVWIFVFGSSTSVSLTNSMLWFYIIIPYTHLMNTKYNKDRILDYGWKQVIVNSVTVFCPTVRRQEQNVQNDMALENLEKDQQSKHIAAKENEINIEPDLSIISFEPQFEDPNAKPCSSNEANGNDDQEHKEVVKKVRQLCTRGVYPDSSLDTDSNSDAPLPLPKSYRLQKGKEILSFMWSNIYVEDVYIHYLRQMIEMEDFVKNGHNVKNFELKNHLNIFAKSPCKIKTSFLPEIFPGLTLDNRNHDVTRSKTKPTKDLMLDVRFVGEFYERIRQRQDKLENFLLSCDDEASFEDLVKQLIIFEEDLIL